MDFLAAQPESYIKIGLLPMLDDDKVKNEIVFDASCILGLSDHHRAS